MYSIILVLIWLAQQKDGHRRFFSASATFKLQFLMGGNTSTQDSPTHLLVLIWRWTLVISFALFLLYSPYTLVFVCWKYITFFFGLKKYITLIAKNNKNTSLCDWLVYWLLVNLPIFLEGGVLRHSFAPTRKGLKFSYRQKTPNDWSKQMLGLRSITEIDQ